MPRTVARVNNPRNEWMYDAQWGVDVAVSTPRIMTAMVEEAVAVGDLVKVFTFHQSGASIHEVTLPADVPVVGATIQDIRWPADTVLSCIVRGDRTIAPSPEDTLEAGDEMLFILSAEADPRDLRKFYVPHHPPHSPGDQHEQRHAHREFRDAERRDRVGKVQRQLHGELEREEPRHDPRRELRSAAGAARRRATPSRARAARRRRSPTAGQPDQRWTGRAPASVAALIQKPGTK